MTPPETCRPGHRFEVYQDRAVQWRWRLLAANNRVVATSAESYTREADAWRAVAAVVEGVRRIPPLEFDADADGPDTEQGA